MKQIQITEKEAGQRLDRLLSRYLKEAPQSFLYKMLRKKNITLNGKRAEGSEKLEIGDEIRLFLSDETYDKFAGKNLPVKRKSYPKAKLSIIYEDEHILLVNKPAGMLTQKSCPKDLSLNEYLLGYLQEHQEWEAEEMSFRPSVCYRLDRNTSGIVICGKSLVGLRQMSEILRDRSLHKYYLCLVSGLITEDCRMEGWLAKDHRRNQVQILKKCPNEGEAAPIATEYRPLKHGKDWTLLEVCLITGRSHQIRAHLASIGHPIIGDSKYGDARINRFYRQTYGVSSQLLHACRLEMPLLSGPLSYLSGRCFTAEPPSLMQKIINES